MGQHSPEFLSLVTEAKKGVKEITSQALKEKIENKENITLIDVREDHEWEAGYIAGATHICKGIIERDIEKTIPNKQQPLVLYCGGGFRSALAAESLQKMGYTDVLSLDRGVAGWVDAGFNLSH